MIKHYFKTGIRNLVKYKTQSLISILGLAIGLTFFTVGYHWYTYETSYDSFYPESPQIYRIYTIDKQTGKIMPGAPAVLCSVLNEDFVEAKYATSLFQGGYTYTCDGKMIGSPQFRNVDKEFIKLFPPKVIAGSQSDAIFSNNNNTTYNLMITKEFALKHWRSPEEAIGNILINEYGFTMTVTAVVENPPVNTVFRQEGYYSSGKKENFTDNSPEYYWNFPPNEMYVCLQKNIDTKAFRKKLRTYTIDHQYNPNLYIEITPIADARYKLGSEMSFNLNYIRTFVIAALLLLLCSLFNFSNLQVNRIFERSKEFKLRSSLGAVKRNLFIQMTIEISIQVLLALLTGFFIIEQFTPYIEQILDTILSKNELYIKLAWIGSLGWLVLLLIIFAFISRFIYRLADAVKTGKAVHLAGREWIRKLNIGLQLVICIGFMFSSLILFLQIDRMKNTDMGFDKENLIQVQISDKIYNQFQEEIKKIPSITQCIRGGNFFLSHDKFSTEKEIGWDNKPTGQAYEIYLLRAGIDFAQSMGIRLLKGRYLNESDMAPNDPSSIYCRKVLINKQMSNLLGFTDPIGKMISKKNPLIGEKPDLIYYEIVGVVDDFHAQSLRNPILPTIIEYWAFYDNYFYLRTQPGKEKEALKAVREMIAHISPEGFTPSLAMTVNDWLNQLTRTENASLRLFSLLAALCVLISIFGIYSVSSSHMQQRKKEIAIRKVTGASSTEIIYMFLRKYVLLTFVANLIALPTAYIFVKKWLEQYPNPIGINSWTFMFIILITSLLVSATILSQVLKAANKNPAEVIKSD